MTMTDLYKPFIVMRFRLLSGTSGIPCLEQTIYGIYVRAAAGWPGLK